MNIILAAALVLAYLSVYINPSATAIPSLFGLAYPYLVAANIVMALIWLIFRKWYGLISLFLIAVGFGHLCTISSGSPTMAPRSIMTSR
ncbi:MAG: hypothetical protein MUC30_06205 [Bacteroidales bacterium]|nr:hypothetical protein [Bacteroidales bacterium]